MVSWWVLVAVTLVFVYWLFMDRKPKGNLPPGPKGKFLIGTLPDKGQSFDDFTEGLRKKYGDIFRVKMGARLNIFLMNYPLMKEAYTMPQLQGRGEQHSLQVFTNFTNSGLVFSSGKPWMNARRFALRHLKDLGMGKSSMENIVQEEAEALIKDFSKNLGKPVEVAYTVNVAILNVIWRLVANERFDVNNEEMQNLTWKVEQNVSLMLGPMAMLDYFPWLCYLPQFIKDRYFQTKIIRDNMASQTRYLRKIILEHQRTLDPDNIRDYIDHYLVEMEKQKDDPESTFRTDLMDLTISILDLFSAGAETTSSTIRWFILYMAVHEDVQRKLQSHIDDVVPQDRLPTRQDKIPYLDAVIAEVNRMVCLVPFAVPHCATEDAVVGGYSIPKGTVLMGSIKSVHYDPERFEDPEQFRPERFLDDNGNFVTIEGYMPFGIGRRQCLGEILAKQELFVVAAAIMKTFSIRAPEGVKLTTEHDQPDKQFTLINFAKPYEVVMNKRG